MKELNKKIRIAILLLYFLYERTKQENTHSDIA